VARSFMSSRDGNEVVEVEMDLEEASIIVRRHW
jgi:hypothetical protein